jgi:WD40 repeat protein
LIMFLQPTLHVLACSLFFISSHGSQPPAQSPVPQRLDAAGDQLPENATARLGTTRLKHASLAIDLVYSPDGKILASAGRDNLVRLWDPATGKQIRQLSGHQAIVSCIAFSPDGKVLASGSGDRTIRIWEVATGRELRQLRGHASYIGSIDFSSDGKTLASSGADNTLRLWSVAKGEELRQMPCAPGRGTSGTAFSPDGKFVVAGSEDRSIRLWEVATGKEIRQFVGHTVLPHSAKFSRDGKRLVSGSMEGKVRIWDVDSGGELREIKAVGKVWTVRFSPDGKLIASGGRDCILQLWDAESGKEIRRMLGHASGVSEVAFSPDGKTIASAGHDQTVQLWDVQTGAPRIPFTGHAGAVAAIAISPRDGRIATGGADGMVILWDRDTAKEVARFDCLESYITALAYSPDGRLLAAAGCSIRQRREVIQHDGIAVVDVARGKVIKRFDCAQQRAFALRFSQDGKKLSVLGGDGKIHTWNVETGEELDPFDVWQPQGNMAAAFSPDGSRLALAENGNIRLFDRWTGKETSSIDASDLADAPTAIAFSGDGRTLATAGPDRTVYLWELLTGKQCATIISRGPYISAMAFSPCGRTLAVAGGARRVAGNSLFVEPGSDISIHIHDLAGSQTERELNGHQGTINALTFSRDGKLLLSGSNDCTAVMWDLEPITKGVSNYKELSKDQLEQLWRQLGSEDAGRAFQAMWRLANAKNGVSFLADHIKKPSAEARSKSEDILSKIDGPVTGEDRLSALRGVEVLEHIATPEARQVLEKLARGAANERLTEDAKRSLERIANPVANSK